jgi:hypothetical protein
VINNQLWTQTHTLTGNNTNTLQDFQKQKEIHAHVRRLFIHAPLEKSNVQFLLHLQSFFHVLDFLFFLWSPTPPNPTKATKQSITINRMDLEHTHTLQKNICKKHQGAHK